MNARRKWTGFGLVVFIVVVSAFATASIVGAASGTGAIGNITPAGVKVLYTGGTVPGPGYSIIGRLTLPVGSWAIFGKTELISHGPQTGVECYLSAPGTQDFNGAEMGGGAKVDALRTLAFTSVSNAPNGGYADLSCRVNTPAADRTVTENGTSITAVSVTGVTATSNFPADRHPAIT